MKRSSAYKLDTSDVLKFESDRLSVQAEYFYRLESAYLKTLLKNTRKLLDLGCGNASYISQIRSDFPHIECYGVEKHEELFRQATKHIDNGNVYYEDFLAPDVLRRIINKIKPDTVFVRYVLQHLSDDEIKHLFSVVKNHFRNGTQFIIIDSDLSISTTEPPSESYRQLVDWKTQLRQSQNASPKIGTSLAHLLRDEDIMFKQEVLKIDSDTLGVSEWLEIILPIYSYNLPANLFGAKQRVIDELKSGTSFNFTFTIYTI